MRAEVRKSIEFSLPQAQVFYISSRNKFILVKTTNLSLSPFTPNCFLGPQLFRSPPDPAKQRKQLLRAQTEMTCLGNFKKKEKN